MTMENKPIIEVVQYDAFINDGGDDVRGYADEHGDLYLGGLNTEPRISDADLTVRVHLSSKATPEIAVRQLKRIIEWIEKDAMNNITVMEAWEMDETKHDEDMGKRVIAGLKWQEEHPAETQAYLKELVERARKASKE